MSEDKQDERLAELMNEFLENKEKKPKENGFEQPGLDNKKMLDAIEGQRTEIKALQSELVKLKNSLNERPVDVKMERVQVPEINSLESKISKQNSQIGDLIYQQRMLKTDIEQEKKRKKGAGTFGAMGWLLLVSNVLLWSLIAFFFYSNTPKKNHLVRTQSKKSSGLRSDNKARNSNLNSELQLADTAKASSTAVTLTDSQAIRPTQEALNVQSKPFNQVKVALEGDNNKKDISEEVVQKKELIKKKGEVVARNKSTSQKKVTNSNRPKAMGKNGVVQKRKVTNSAKKTRPIVEKKGMVSKRKNSPRYQPRVSEPVEPTGNDSEPDVTFGD